MPKTRVVNIKKHYYDTYIGRGSKFGNPFHIGIDGDRNEVIRKYEEWIRQQPDLMAALPELRGQILGCHCAPKKCHGHILVKLLEELDRQ